MSLFVKSLLLTLLLTSGAFANTFPAKIDKPESKDIIFDTSTYDEVVEMTYTQSTFHLPALCKNEAYSRTCSFFKNFYVSKFEHDYIGYITDNLDFEDENGDLFIQRDIAYQDVSFDFRVIKELGFMCAVVLVKQEFLDQKATLTDVFNFNLETKKFVHFEDLFEDPTLAAMTCSNLVYNKFKEYGYKNLYVIKAQIEVDPRNYVLLPDGIEFIFTKGTVAPNDVNSRLFISVDDLIAAKPKKEWFPSMKGEILGRKHVSHGIKSKLLN